MADNRSVAVWLQRLAGLVALAGVLALSACGGGSGSPANVLNPTPPIVPTLVVLPTATTVYSGVPSVLTISGGVAPYRAFSSNGTVLPVAQSVAGTSVVLLASDVASDTPVVVTIQDSASQTAPASVTVRAATLLNTFTVTPNLAECGAAAICSGQTGTAAIVVQAPGGGTAPGRQVRFDVVSGPYSIVTNNPAQPTAATLTVVSDAAGVAQVIVRANVDAPTQPAQLRATDLTSGQQRTSQFMIVQNTNGATILTIVPDKVTIQGVFKNECSAGARADYYIFGGTPPYRVTPSFPDAIVMVNTTVQASGGFFEVATNGTCVQPLTFSVLDATGRQTTATLENLPGTADRPGPAPIPPLVLAPSTVTGICTNSTFTFVVAGGGGTITTTVSPRLGTNPTPSGVAPDGSFTVQFGVTPITAGSTFTVSVRDTVGSVGTATIACTG